MTTAQRFWAKVLKTPYCWLWTGAILRDGHGQLWSGTKAISAHRFSYELFKGPIAKGHQIDHLCCTPACVNPDHLEAVTPREHLMRGLTLAGINARKTECPKGHLLSGSNLYVQPDGRRSCRTCKTARKREWNRTH